MLPAQYIELMAELRADAKRGEFRRYPEAISTFVELNSSDGEAAVLALQYALSLISPRRESGGTQPILELSSSVSEIGRAYLIWACESLGREAVLTFDSNALAAVIEALSALTKVGNLFAFEGFLAFFRADEEKLRDCANKLSTWAREHQRADLLVEGVALRSWAAQLRGDQEEALNFARRASRMARTESIPHAEYIANIALAHARRRMGMPHLSVHILMALVRVAPVAYREWMRLELVLASGNSGTVTQQDRAEVLQRAVKSADEECFRLALHSLSEFRPMYDEVVCLQHLVVGHDFCEARAFQEGHSDTIPNGFALIGCDGAKHPVWVYGRPGRKGLRLISQRALALEVRQLGDTPRTRYRTDSALAALILAGPEGVNEELFFKQLYGFAFETELHSNMFTTLLARVRDRLGDVGTMVRDDRLAIILQEEVILPDPRCDAPDDVELLTWLGRRGGKSAKEAAAELGISVRKVQDALAKLVEEGACKVDREGRRRIYSVDDTTFSQMTRF